LAAFNPRRDHVQKYNIDDETKSISPHSTIDDYCNTAVRLNNQKLPGIYIA